MHFPFSGSFLRTITTVIYGLVSFASQAAHGETASSLEPTPWLAAYSVYVGGDVEYVCSDFEGTFAAGGSARFARMGLATRVSTPMAAAAARLDFSLRDGSVGGDVEAGRDATLQNYSVASVTAGHDAFCIDGSDYGCRSFFAPNVSYDRLASELSAYGALIASLPTQRATTSPDGTLTLAASVNGISTFNIDAASLLAAESIVIGGGLNSTVVLVVEGETVNLAHLGDRIQLRGYLDASRVLYAFLDATSLTLGDVVLFGSVLAPRANVVAYEGRVEGSFWVGGSLVGNPLGLSLADRVYCQTGGSGLQINYKPFTPAAGNSL